MIFKIYDTTNKFVKSILSLLAITMISTLFIPLSATASERNLEHNPYYFEHIDLNRVNINDLDLFITPERERGLLSGKILFTLIKSGAFKGLSNVSISGTLFRPVAKNVVNNAVRNFQQVRITIGRHNLLMRTQDMVHTLGRHHPNFWRGQQKATNTFFTRSTNVNNIRSIAISVLNQNQNQIRNLARASGQFRGVVNGVTYVVALNNGAIATVFPVSR